MRGRDIRGNFVVSLARVLASRLILNATFPFDVLAQANPLATAIAQPAAGQSLNAEQLDALLAPIALYPDDLLTQVLMASAFPLEVVTAARWVEEPAHWSLSCDALAKALEAEPWDASVKSLVAFPVVLATMNSSLSWLQQLGYAFATLQADVFAPVQRLRRQSRANAHHRGVHRPLHKEDEAGARPSRLKNGHRKSRLRRYRRKQKGNASTSFDMGVMNDIERHLIADVTDPTSRHTGGRNAGDPRQARRAGAAHRAMAMRALSPERDAEGE
jgi:hypothetical protein